MSRYFARLAQRSDVAPRTSRAVDPSTAPPTFERSLEQHSEVVAAPRNSPASPIAPIAVAPSAVAETQTSIAPSSVTGASPSTSRRATRPVLGADYLHTTQSMVTPAQTPTRVAATASTEVHVDAAIDGVPTKPHRAVATTTYVYDIGAVERISPDSSIAPLSPAANDRDRVARSADAVTSNDMTSNGTTLNDAVRARPVAHAVTSTQSPANRASDSTSTVSVPQPSARTAEVHVHIGKIELDVHAPTPPSPKQPAPVPAVAPVAPTPARAPRFNAHRHYLRGG